MRPALDARSPLGALGPGEIEQALSDPTHAAALLAELDHADQALARAGPADPRHRMLAVSISLARQIYLEHLLHARPSSLPTQELPP